MIIKILRYIFVYCAFLNIAFAASDFSKRSNIECSYHSESTVYINNEGVINNNIKLNKLKSPYKLRMKFKNNEVRGELFYYSNNHTDEVVEIKTSLLSGVPSGRTFIAGTTFIAIYNFSPLLTKPAFNEEELNKLRQQNKWPSILNQHMTGAGGGRTISDFGSCSLN